VIVRTIVDTGPLVALLLSDERHHDWARRTFAELSDEGLVTCEGVITETCFLLRRTTAAIDALFRRLGDGTIRLASMEAHLETIHSLMKRYRNVPASYADACLVRLSELHPDAIVVTADSDFRIYRRNGRQALPLRMP